MEKVFTTTIKTALICLSMIIALTAGKSTDVNAADTFKIGYIDPRTGPFEYIGRGYLVGLQFIVDEQNAKGGLLGKKIEIIAEDSELKPDVAIRKAKKLLLEDKVDILCTGTGSHVVTALNKVATEYKKVLINYATFSDTCQGKDFSRYVFRTTQNNYNLTAAQAKYMASMPYRKYYIICQDYVFGHDIAKGFKTQLSKYLPDAKIVGEDFHPLANKDFAPYINKIIASKADAVYSANWGPDGSLMVKQARALGLKAPFPFVMPISGNDPYFMNELKDDAVGVYSCYNYDMRIDMPENKAFIERYHAKHKNDKDFLTWWPAMLPWQTIMGFGMTFAAIEKAGSFDAEKIINAYEGFQWKSPIGLMQMRACDHQNLQPMVAGVVKPGLNPWYNGSIRPDVKFPWMGPDVVVYSPNEVAIPATPDYNPRCK